jgi:lysozyme family protein
MRDNKVGVFDFTYREEGGYSNDKHDPGGATNLGIIQVEYNAFRQSKGLPALSVRQITHAEADEIYSKKYWAKIDGDELPLGIDLVLYDYAVNSGPSRAIAYAQRVLRLRADGVMGPVTMEALKAADAKTFISRYDALRLSFLQGLAIWRYFGGGWKARVRRCTDTALKMAGEPAKHKVVQLPVLVKKV